MRRYFITDKSKAKIEDLYKALEMCIGENNTQRYSLDRNFILIKTTQKEIDKMLRDFPGYTFEQILELTFSTEYSQENLKTILNGPEWTKEEVI